MIALTATSIAGFALALILIGFVVYALFNIRGGRTEIGAERMLAPNRTPYFDDETLEGPRLERLQLMGVLLLAVITIGLPLYWVFEPNRQAEAQYGWDQRFANWGAELFAPTADGGFNCAGCHGGMGATGGVAAFTVTDPQTQEVKPVSWKAPALNTVLYRFDESEVTFILTYGRPGSPMSPWGTAGGGPMTSQQIETLVSYLKRIQIPREGCLDEELAADDVFGQQLCGSGSLPQSERDNVQAAIERSMETNGYSEGEAIFNLELNSGAYSCARCHTQGWSYDEPGVSGQGNYGWNLTGGSTAAHFPTEDAMAKFIADGSEFGKGYGQNAQGSGRMPGFGKLLTDDQIRAVVEYVRSL